MSALRKEIQSYIDNLPDSKLEALKPLLTILVEESFAMETDLTDEERSIIEQGREEYQRGNFVPLN